MIRSRVNRVLLLGGLAGASALVTLPLGSASAALPSIKCGKLTGTISTTVTLSKCSGNTGGASKAMPAASLASGGTINWVNGKSTTVTLKVSTTEHDTTETLTCPAGTTEYEAKGKVTADTTGSAPVGGVAKAEVCADSTGNLSLEPGSKALLK
jgi:hypothetical protein